MPPINPNWILVVIGVVFLAACVLLGEVLALGGDVSQQVTRAAIVTGFAGTLLISLTALLQGSRAINHTNGVQSQVDNHDERQEAQESRIAFLEARLGIKPQKDDKATAREG